VSALAQDVHALWRRIVTDELVYEAMLQDQHRARAEALRLSEEDLAVLDEFRAQPGTVWAVENIRFRGTSMTQRTLKGRLPCTVQLLTQGNSDWLWDLTYEYLAWCRWEDLGHARAAEALRFVDFVRRRVMTRRRFPDYMESVLQYESAVNALLQRCSTLTADGWPGGGDLLAARLDDARPCLAPTASVLALTHDLVDWLRGPTGQVSWFEARSGPPPAQIAATLTYVVLHLASAEARVEPVRLDPDQHVVLAACRGEQTGREVVAHAQRSQRSLSSGPDVATWLRAWARQGILIDAEAP
jgi:hypothetical protein